MSPPDKDGAAGLDARIIGLLAGVAPDIDPAAIAPDVAFRDQFDFDSMDLLRFASALHAHFGIDIPEKDYRQLASLAGCRDYVASRLSDGQQ